MMSLEGSIDQGEKQRRKNYLHSLICPFSPPRNGSEACALSITDSHAREALEIVRELNTRTWALAIVREWFNCEPTAAHSSRSVIESVFDT